MHRRVTRWARGSPADGRGRATRDTYRRRGRQRGGTRRPRPGHACRPVGVPRAVAHRRRPRHRASTPPTPCSGPPTGVGRRSDHRARRGSGGGGRRPLHRHAVDRRRADPDRLPQAVARPRGGRVSRRGRAHAGHGRGLAGGDGDLQGHRHRRARRRRRGLAPDLYVAGVVHHATERQEQDRRGRRLARAYRARRCSPASPGRPPRATTARPGARPSGTAPERSSPAPATTPGRW